MLRAFTEPEQIKLLEHPQITYVGKRTIKFDKSVLKQISETCTSSPDIRNLLNELGIPQIALDSKRMSRLYMRYVFKGHSNGRIVPRKYFTDDEINTLLKLSVVSKATSSTLTFTAEFKKDIAMCKNLSEARDLMIQNDVPLAILGERRFENTYYRLRNQLQKKGVAAFSSEQRGRKASVNSTQYKNLSDAEKVALLEKRLEERDDEVDFLKKYMPSLQNCKITSKDWYAAIYMACRDGKYVPYKLCKVASVNPSGYYHYVRRKSYFTSKMVADAMILADIQYLQNKHMRVLGYRQVTMQLNRFYKNINLPVINSKRILRIMRENSQLAIIRKKNPRKTMWKATKEDKFSPNILQREFTDGDKLEKILTDISYLRCKFGFVYLSAAKDSVTREIVAHNVKDNMGLGLSLEILEDLSKLNLSSNVMVHSDQGVHYSAKRYRELLVELGITQSMSRRGNCWDNAPMESFFGHMKDEINFMEFETLEEVQYAVKQYMIYYNYERPQWNLKKMTPVEYRNHLKII